METLVKLTMMVMMMWSGSSFAMSLEQWKARVVKIQSHKAFSTVEIEGSGIIATTKLKNLNFDVWNNRILTSEHILIPEVSTYSAHHSDFAMVNVRVEQSSYTHGLAKLEFQSNLRHEYDWLDLESMNRLASFKDLEFYAIGFPAGSSEVRVVGPGYMNDSQSHRALMPGVASVYELRDLPVEFGMSGGVLLVRAGPDDYYFAGILSHQYLKREGGRATVLENADGNQSMASTDLTMAIPYTHVKEWYAQPEPDYDALDFIRHLNEETGEQTISYGPLEFRIVRGDPKAVVETEVGGMHFGGADGSGIGGWETVDAEKIAMIEITNNRDLWRLDDKNIGPRFREWSKAIEKGGALHVIGLMSPQKELIGVGSYDHFFTRLLRDKYEVVTVPAPIGKLGQVIDARVDLAARLSTLSAETFRLVSNAAVGPMLKQINDDAFLLGNLLIQPRDFAKYLRPDHDQFWRALVMENFDLSIELESLIVETVESE